MSRVTGFLNEYPKNHETARRYAERNLREVSADSDEAKIIRFLYNNPEKGHCHRYCGAEDASEGECVGCGGIVGEQVTACRHMKKIPIFFSTERKTYGWNFRSRMT